MLVFVALQITRCYSFTTTVPTRLTKSAPTTQHEMAFELMDGFSYTEVLSNYPLVTSSLTSGCFCGIGDALAQHKESQEQLGY
jgi:hypothetical protein